MTTPPGYIGVYEIDQGDAWVNAVDPKQTDPIPFHTKCGLENEMLCGDEHDFDPELISLTEIMQEEADKYVCVFCRRKVSESPDEELLPDE